MQVRILAGRLLYKALHPWQHDDLLDLPDEEANALIGQGIVESTAPVAPVPSKAKGEDKAKE